MIKWNRIYRVHANWKLTSVKGVRHEAFHQFDIIRIKKFKTFLFPAHPVYEKEEKGGGRTYSHQI